MIAERFPEPPPGFRIDSSDGLSIHFPRLGLRSVGGWSGLWDQIGGLGICLLILLVAIGGRGYWLAPAGAGAAILILVAAATFLRPRVTVRGDLLCISAGWSIRMGSGQWRRSELLAVGYWQGLRVVTAASNHCLLRNWNRAELQWVAAVLRQALGVPSSLPPHRNEVPITYYGTFWDSPQEGELSAKAGTLQIRDSLSPQPHLVFLAAAEGPRLFRQLGALYLSPTEIVCRVDGSGATSLHISPANVTCRVRVDRVPILTVGVVEPILHSRVHLPAGVAEKTHIAPESSQFWLTVSCDDRAALPHALESFWSDEAR